jgi:hypothetical protein
MDTMTISFFVQQAPLQPETAPASPGSVRASEDHWAENGEQPSP